MQIWNPTATITRPADTTAYAAGDIIANSTTAGSIVPMQFPLGGNNMPGATRITRVRFAKSGTTNTLSQFRLHLYGSLPAAVNGDNAAWSTTGAANYLGSIDGPTTLNAFSDGCAGVGAAVAGSEILVRLNSGTVIYGLLAALAAYVPASAETFTVTLECVDAW